jgi:G3E family GTPase
VTLVDGAQALQQLAAHGEPAKQIALADRIFITKADLVNEAQRQAVEQAVRALNPRAPVSTLLHGEVDPAELTGLGLASARASPTTLSFLGESLAGEGAAGERHLGQRPALHDGSIRTLSLRFETPFTWPAFSAALELLTTLRGPDLLRVKGIVNVEGKPVVVQGVQHIFHDPVELDRWPSADTGTRLVFITRGIDAATIRNLLSAVAAASPASNPVSTPGR